MLVLGGGGYTIRNVARCWCVMWCACVCYVLCDVVCHVLCDVVCHVLELMPPLQVLRDCVLRQCGTA